MSRIFINESSQSNLDFITNNMPQSILLHGLSGVGLFTIARYIAGKDLSHIEQPLTKKGEVSPSSGTISAEKIRDLYNHTRTRHTGKRVVIIDDADTMSTSAQNSFLKLLEEPNSSTYFILTSHHPEKLLSTVRSRLQEFNIAPCSGDQTEQILDLKKIYEPKKRTQIKFLAAGLPAEIDRLLSDDKYFASRAQLVADARDLLQSKPYDKLLIIAKYHSDRAASLGLLELSIRILRLTIKQTQDAASINKLAAISKAYENISSNMNPRLQLMHAMLY